MPQKPSCLLPDFRALVYCPLRPSSFLLLVVRPSTNALVASISRDPAACSSLAPTVLYRILASRPLAPPRVAPFSDSARTMVPVVDCETPIVPSLTLSVRRGLSRRLTGLDHSSLTSVLILIIPHTASLARATKRVG